MASHVLGEIGGVEIFPIISLLIFFSFFVGVTLYALSRRKKEMQAMENFVLDESDRWDDEDLRTKQGSQLV